MDKKLSDVALNHQFGVLIILSPAWESVSRWNVFNEVSSSHAELLLDTQAESFTALRVCVLNPLPLKLEFRLRTHYRHSTWCHAKSPTILPKYYCYVLLFSSQCNKDSIYWCHRVWCDAISIQSDVKSRLNTVRYRRSCRHFLLCFWP